MSEAMPRTDSKYVPYPVGAIPETRTNFLSLLRHYGDGVAALSPAQLAAARRLYFLDDLRSIAQLVRAGEIQP
jgi:hypothetical protein